MESASLLQRATTIGVVYIHEIICIHFNRKSARSFFFSQKHTLLFSFLREKLPKKYYKQLRAGFKEDLSGWLSTVATHLPTFYTTTWTDLAWYLEWCQIWSLWFMPQVLQEKRTVRSCQIHFRPLFCRTMVYKSSSVFHNISAFSSPFSNQFSWQVTGETWRNIIRYRRQSVGRILAANKCERI